MKIGINGFGRIGRNILRAAQGRDEFDVAVINDITDAGTLAHLFKYDSTYGLYPGEVEAGDGQLVIDGKAIPITSERDPAKLDWGKRGVQVALECSGLFNNADAGAYYLESGVKKVLFSAPAKGDGIFTVVLGVNSDKYDPARHHLVSNASCTTNCLAPVVKVLHEKFGVQCGLLNTIHSYTNDQRILDQPHQDLRRARAAGLSMIPTSTGAAKAIGLVMPELAGKLDGFSIRVPTPTVSIVDFTATLEKSTSVEEVNDAFREAAGGALEGILGYSAEPLVSMDYKGDPRSSIVDGLSTAVTGGNMVKVLSWYDNEWGFSNRMVDVTGTLL
ncbi:MAG: type I glyceraldehyde-3-phosphate dehydrogenase [SAR324 cluster bacterium]|nr:type I glyceraldehyde-3-phosphate dehydrogenase [SAR324 cluster bacterium]